MKLSDLIRKGASGAVATATPAIPATDGRDGGAAVAKIAVVAVASPPAKPAASRRWQLHFTHHSPVVVTCCPNATHAEILASHPDAIAVEPFTPALQPPSAPLTPLEAMAITSWLHAIGEDDETTIRDVIDACRSDAGHRSYCLKRAAELAGRPLLPFGAPDRSFL